MDPNDIIVKTAGTLSGRARINGTRIGVSDIWLAYLRALDEVAIPRILKDFSHLKEEQVRAALDYARKHPEEIEQELEKEEEEMARKGSRQAG